MIGALVFFPFLLESLESHHMPLIVSHGHTKMLWHSTKLNNVAKGGFH